MATPRNRKALATKIVLGVTMFGSLALIVWQRLTAGRIDDLIDKAYNALAAGDLEAFEGYRGSASILLQTSQSQYPWTYAGYLGLGLVLVAVWSGYIPKVRAP
jgi:hypothetical protein